ncbi:MAG: hypothetical protein LBC52_02460 [Treponema sp.]|nr:hypothetical protein [Treponema sp.]
MALVFSCSQDPIFYTISTEPIPVKPRIQGGPTNMTVFERTYSGKKVSIMYVASGDLHWYAKAERGAGEPGWDSAEYKIPQPGGKVIGLAATGEHLYALCIIGTGVTTVLRRIGPAEDDWSTVPLETGIRYRLVQSIFANGERLFAGAMSNNSTDYGILYLKDSSSAAPSLGLLASDTEMLSGAARLGAFHYLSTRGKGVYKIAEAAFSNVTGPNGMDISQLQELVRKKDEDGIEPAGVNYLFMGMIQLEGEDGAIIAIERNGGTLFEVKEIGFTRIRYSNGANAASGRFATGALALWRQVIRGDDGQNPKPGEKRMLIAGIQGGLFSTTTSSSFTHGYVEIELDTVTFEDGWLVLNNNRNISPDLTVDGNTDRYTATIGKHPINHMYQTSQEIDVNMTFFASTQTAGLWSYRDREGGWQWNAEK